jgi:tetratricopeptide (TPR) repeat protein
MSLLLDALKEAEARKRGPAAPTAVEPSFETDGNLALAEEVAPAPEPRSEAAAPPARREAAPGDALLAARAARDTPAPQAAAASNRDPVPRPAAPAVAATAREINLLPWLIGVVGLLMLVLGGFALFEALGNRNSAAPGATIAPATSPDTASSAAAGSANGDIVLQPLPTPAAPVVPRPAAAFAGPRAAPPRTPVRELPATGAAPLPAAERLSISREPAPLAAAWAALQRGDVAQAGLLYQRVLDAEPGQVDAELGLAVIAHARGDDEAARRGYRRVLESVPDHARAWGGLAELVGDGELGQIESRLRQLLAARPAAPLHFALGNVLARQQRWSDAQLEYFAAASLESRSADYAFNVAVALERIGKPGAALPWYRRAVELAGEGRAAGFDAAAIRGRIAELEAVQP